MIKLLRNLHKKEIIFILIAVVLMASQVWLDLKIPDYMATITKLVQSAGNEMKDVLYNGGMMLLCSIGSLITAFIIGYLAAYTGTSFERNLRKKLFSKVESFGMEEIKDFSTSSLITRNTNDVTQVKMFIIMSVSMLVKAPIMAIMAILKISGKEWEFSLITIIGVIVIIILSLIIVLIAIPKFKKIQKLTDNLNEITRENLTGIRVVRAYNAEDFELKRFNKANRELTDTHLFTSKIMALMSPTMSMVMNGLSLGIYFVGAGLINAAIGMDKLTIFSDMVVFSSYAIQIILSFMVLVILFALYPRAAVAGTRINEVLETKPSISYGKINKDSNKIKGVVEFKNVSFKYPDAEEYVLKDISFKVSKGETVAIIGSTGSGKSTLINLIPRFYDTSSGEILIDDINIKDMSLEYLNDKLGYISQQAQLFKGSIKDNVKLGKINNKKVSDAAVKKALKIAKVDDFVNSLEAKEDYDLAQGGHNVSGGQKQRISIARAIARDPEIYIFDDTFSALDYKTDLELRKQLNKHTKDATKFIVAQRIGTIKDADQIIVLDEGKIVGIGKHKDLLKNCQVYLEIAESQLSKEEIENAWA